MLTDEVQTLRTKLRGRGPRDILDVIRRRLGSTIQSYGLRRDLTVPFNAPEATIPIWVRPLQASDVPALFTAGQQARAEKAERMMRLRMYEAGLSTCWVAVTEAGEPCYCQWIIGPEQNDEIAAHFTGIFPRLRADEALLEGAYTPNEFRGKKIMPAAMAQIAEKRRELGARWALTFVDHDNVPSLKGSRRAGFTPYLWREQRWRLFRHHVRFEELPEGTRLPFEGGAPSQWP